MVKRCIQVGVMAPEIPQLFAVRGADDVGSAPSKHTYIDVRVFLRQSRVLFQLLADIPQPELKAHRVTVGASSPYLVLDSV